MKLHFETQAIHVGSDSDAATGAVIPPIYATSTYEQEAPGVHKGFDYSRADNPTRQRLEHALAALEGAEYAITFASGVAATSAVVTLLKPKDHVLAGDDTYGGTYRLFEQIYRKYGLEFSYVDTSCLDSVSIQKNTKMIWIESPTNPLMKITDIAGVAKRKKGALLVVDNTFASPYLQRPLELGADLAMHSTTKYLGGHSDLIGGALMTNDKAIYEELKFIQKAVGAIPSPFDCFLVHRGIKTLAVRMKAHSENAQRIAEFLSESPKVKNVYYPGLPSHPQHEVARRQMRAFSGMLSFELKADATRFLRNLKVIVLAESLGGIESLINHPAIMTHASLPAEERTRRGIGDNLLRLSVGIEHPDDLIADLENALSAI
ncbi:MAG: cystathionine gamma-synthase [Candidatus Fraserbacteria bacterium RBG_16_55_9]|uniref:Cystathionine gamma-synthase n=1 Tax=Fraserbacteria sp. (strain RBG_16_55_9) TaxID=1817864 RepID=A0A1F5USQ8_FRAXR|nr:MAG: cystathionine gamma-synthase [Candidatus Fraserbacteria bacterium RBG_16_55_9]